jgi:hypothetical protein
MRKMISFYALINILSIDVAIGAVLSSLFFSAIFQVTILPYGLAALALTVWIIYTVDHLRDAKVIGPKATSERHRFHFRHQQLLQRIVMVAIVADLAVILFMRKPVFIYGFYLAGFVLIYLIFHRALKFAKELFIAILYGCGVLLPSISVSTIVLQPFHYLLILQFVLTAWINLLVFSFFDYEQDVSERQNSFSTTFGKRTTRITINTISTINIMAWIFQQQWPFFTASLVFIMMNAVLLIILYSYQEKQKITYRCIGDAVFFLPGIYWLWHQL